jgi:hypothetical protein
MIARDENLVSLEELGSVLITNQGSPYPRSRGRNRLAGWIRPGSRRRGMVVFAAVAVAAAAAGAAFGGVQQVLDWFHGTPPTPTVQQDYVKWNAAAAARNFALAHANLAADAPTIDMSTIHGVLAVQLDGGPAYLWSGKLSDGGACWLVQFSGDSVGGEPASADGCITSAQVASAALVEQISSASGSSLILGHAPNAASASLGLSDGTVLQAPVVEGYFLASISNGTSVKSLTTYDASSNEAGDGTIPAPLPMTTATVGTGEG